MDKRNRIKGLFKSTITEKEMEVMKTVLDEHFMSLISAVTILALITMQYLMMVVLAIGEGIASNLALIIIASIGGFVVVMAWSYFYSEIKLFANILGIVSKSKAQHYVTKVEKKEEK